MCYFITIAVPRRDGAKLEEWRQRFYHLARQENRSFSKHLPHGYTCWTLTDGHCSCKFVQTLKANDSQVRLKSDAVEILRSFVTAPTKAFLYLHFYSGGYLD